MKLWLTGKIKKSLNYSDYRLVITISSKWLLYILLETVRGRNEFFESLKNSCFKRKFWASKDKTNCEVYYSVYSFGIIRYKIGDPKSLGLWCIRGCDGFTMGGNSSLPFIRRWSRITNHDVDLPKGTHPLRTCGSVVYRRGPIDTSGAVVRTIKWLVFCGLIKSLNFLTAESGLPFPWFSNIYSIKNVVFETESFSGAKCTRQ